MQYAGTYTDMESPPTVYITTKTYAHALCSSYMHMEAQLNTLGVI